MSGEDILNLIDASLLSDDAPPLTDAEVETFLFAPVKRSPPTLKRMRKRFVAKVFEALHPEPVRRVERGLRFGEWIEATRDRARLTRDAVGEALGQDQLYVERVESEEILLWKITPSKAADIVILFRVHVDAPTQMLSASFRVVRDAEVIRRQHEALARGRPASSGDMYAGMMERGGRRSANREPEQTPDTALSEEVTRFLEKLRKILEQRKAFHLL
jgi:transcriptional regulator with XRE-family HTH domain